MRGKHEKSIDFSNFVYGKVPPQSRDLEGAILGAIMLERDAFDEINTIIKKKECFYVDAHQRIFEAMKKLHSVPNPIDILTVVEQLKIQGELDIVGGPHYVTKLTNAVVSSANIKKHSYIILGHYIKRELIKISGEIMQQGYSDESDPYESYIASEKLLFDLGDFITGSSTKRTYHEVVQHRSMDIITNEGGSFPGIRTGYKDFDEKTEGLQEGLLYTGGSRPGMGKTAVVVNWAENISLGIPGFTDPVPVGVIEMETSDIKFADRHLALKTGIPAKQLRKGGLSDEDRKKVHLAQQQISKQPIYVDFDSMTNIDELKSKARKLKRKHNIGVLIIDYLQIIEASDADEKKSRDIQITRICKGLLDLAKELRIPVVALCQVGRSSLKKENKKPDMSDFRESGGIEQTSRVMFTIHRPEYYDITGDESLGIDYEPGYMEWDIIKNNDGEKGMAQVIMDYETNKIIDRAVYLAKQTSGPKLFIQQGAGYIPVIDEDAPF